jgi:hypothetical protein
MLASESALGCDCQLYPFGGPTHRMPQPLLGKAGAYSLGRWGISKLTEGASSQTLG